MNPRIWGIPLVILALLAGVAFGMHQAGVQWPWRVARPRAALRPDLGSEARLGSPIDAAPLPPPPGPAPAPSPAPVPAPVKPNVPVEGEVVYLGDRGRAILTGKSGILLVTSADGKELLRQSGENLEGWWSWQAGGTTLLWLRYYDTGALRRNRIFRYDRGADQFLPVEWGSQGRELRSTLTFVGEGSYLREQMPVDPYHTRTVYWRYTGTDRLQQSPGPFNYDPAWYPASADALLIAFLESVGMGLPEEARRYFVDPQQADSFYRILSEQILSYGHAHVLLGDAIDARKQEYPFFLDMEGLSPEDHYYSISLQGSVGLAPTADGKRLQIDTWRYSVAPEPINRAGAIARVTALPEVRDLPASQKSFQTAHGYTHWTLVFAGGGPVYEVDSRSGEVFRLAQDGKKVPVPLQQTAPG